MACDDDSGGNGTSKVTNAVTAGTAYYLLAGGSGGATSNLVFHLAFTATASVPAMPQPIPEPTPLDPSRYLGTYERASVRIDLWQSYLEREEA